MCGIAGFIRTAPGGTKNAKAIITRMTDSLIHRGPDAMGIWIEDEVALGHRRLSILDLSQAGAQPMHSACGRFVIVFNGEIYNHLELRRDLEENGAAPSWNGHSDTETLLAGISHWGLEETLQRAGGMFALAVWDRREKRLSLARDRIGEKPLYWGWVGDALAFGSELKALRAHPSCPSTICREALAQYLTYAYVPVPRSIYPGIYKLEPGCILQINGSVPFTPPRQPLRPSEHYEAISISRYWSLNETIEKGHQSLISNQSEVLQTLETTLSQAIGRQMISDVPLGAFLSGGIDSSIIVALMQAQSSRPVKTFTVGFESAAFNEAPHAAAVARHLGTDHTEITVTEHEARDVIPQLADLYDEPFADSSQIPTHLVCKIAREHVTVALSGDAGDELLGGYNRYFWGPKIWNRLDWMPFSMRRLLGKAVSIIPVAGWDQIGSLAKGKFKISQLGDKAHNLSSRLLHVKTDDDLYRSLVSLWRGQDLVRQIEDLPLSPLDDALPRCLDDDSVARMMAQDMRSYLPDDILCKVDRAAMGVSLETRVPFLDPKVIEMCACLPADMKIRNGQGKWALRQVLYNHVPREMIERPKAGFGIPVGEWLRGPLRAWAEELLTPEALAVDDLLDPVPILTAWNEHLSGSRDWTHKLWIILMFQAWRARWT